WPESRIVNKKDVLYLFYIQHLTKIYHWYPEEERYREKQTEILTKQKKRSIILPANHRKKLKHISKIFSIIFTKKGIFNCNS
ncbi:MAG: hypothetical protein JW842_04055, partial [Prolixibacteraceae bacterium]|nr:hypothetical protein [Prolixibacteraceae bacterium]